MPKFKTVLARFRKFLFIFGAVLIAVLSTSCKKKSAETSSEQPYNPPKLSDAQFRYGVSPTRNAKVTYQDDVVIVEHGEDAIRGVSSDGLSVTIDASLPEAQQMQPGKIVFLTSRAVGRVLGSEPDGSNLKLTLGPVDITEVIKDADLNYDQPLDFNTMTTYSAPDFPGADIEAPKLTRNLGPASHEPHLQNAVALSVISPNGEWAPMRGYRDASWDSSLAPADDPHAWTAKDVAAVRRLAASYPAQLPSVPKIPGAPKLPAPPPVPGIPSTVNIGDFKLTPFCCGGIGIKIVHDTSAVKVIAYAVIRLNNPKLHFDLNIQKGKVQKAGVTLDGAAGLTMDFEAGSNVGVNGNINKEITLPVDFSVPIVGLPVPVAVTLHQSFILKTAFSAKDATLKATGDYAFTGSLFMGYKDGQWTVGAPTNFTIKQSLMQSISGASVGVNGLVLAYQGKVIVGIGAFGFATGPYVGYITSIGVTRGSDLGIVQCRGATLDVSMSVGVGYVIPQPVTDAINFVLRNLNMTEIKRSAGLEHRESLITKQETNPPSCGK